MNVQYKKIFDLDIRHDYYLLWDESDPPDYSWPDNYSILNDLDFIPTKACAVALRNQKIIFRKTATGFVLLAEAGEDDNGDFHTFVPIAEDLKLDFFVVVKQPFFQNFTNLRLTENRNKIYYFNNIGKSVLSSNYYLSTPHPLVSIGDSGLYLGDIIENGGTTYELIENVLTPDVFALANAIELNTTDVRYITTQDRIDWQSPNYKYTADNDSPGEIITFTLTDINSDAVALGNIPATGKSQGKYTAAQDADQPVQHSIDLSHLKPGKYTMTIKRFGGTETEIFYLLNPQVQPNAFGVIEIFPFATDFEFANKEVVDIDEKENEVTVIYEKTYTLRFKNRSTVWQYFDKEENELTDPDNEEILPLTKKQTEFSLEDKIRPDPDISMIYPESTTDGLIEKIYSKTYLNQ